jgi:hypothetical protein
MWRYRMQTRPQAAPIQMEIIREVQLKITAEKPVRRRLETYRTGLQRHSLSSHTVISCDWVKWNAPKTRGWNALSADLLDYLRPVAL